MTGVTARGARRFALAIEQFSRDRAEDVARIFCESTAAHRYCGLLTPEIVLDRLCVPSYFDPAGLLIAYRGGRPIGYAHGTFGKPQAGETRLNYGIGNIRALFFPPDDIEAGRALLEHLIAYLAGRGATDLQGWGSLAGYPFYRGLYLGTEPVLSTSHAHAIIRLVQAGFCVNQYSIFLTRPMEAPPPSAPASPQVDLAEAPLGFSTTWDAETWAGLEPMQTTAWRGDRQVAQITWALLHDLTPKHGHPVGSIAALRVDDTCRRQGIARTLVLEVMRQCHYAGAREVAVATTQENTGALHTYYACGFEEIEILLGHGRAQETAAAVSA
jgi:ribosomal protein S18 acetylase RimI-like enzyme